MSTWHISMWAAWFVCAPLLSGCMGNSTPALLARAQAGDAAAQYEYGRRLLTGQKTPPNPTFAPGWFRAAALQGHAKAQAALGACYQRGLGTPRHEREALRWYNKAAVQGEEHALLAMLEYAEHQKTPAAAKRCLQDLLNANNSAAELYMAIRLLRDDARSKRNSQQAVDYLRYAAMDGIGDAAYMLALCYAAGCGVAPSPRLALGWLRCAAELHCAPAVELLQQIGAAWENPPAPRQASAMPLSNKT